MVLRKLKICNLQTIQTIIITMLFYMEKLKIALAREKHFYIAYIISKTKFSKAQFTLNGMAFIYTALFILPDTYRIQGYKII